MQYQADTVDHYITLLPEDRKDPVEKLRQVVAKNLPKGFEEGLSYKMVGFYVPHSIYPAGYHCDTKLPLPFINIASLKSLLHSTIVEYTPIILP